MKEIPQYKFYKHKYGNELLVDVIDVDTMRKDIWRTSAYCTTFYSIIIFTEGSEDVAIDGRRMHVTQGCVACSRPGETWAWQADTRLEGLHLLFEEEFLLSFFNDPLFLDKFPFLRADRPSPFLRLADGLYDRLVHLFKEMRKEINNDSPNKDEHILRAMLYETLMLLNRAEQARPAAVSGGTDVASMRYIDAFRTLVGTNFKTRHNVDYYADALCITPNYLNKIVRRHLGVSTKQYVMGRIVDEAKRLLCYTMLSVAEIADSLNFDTATYFVRIFRKYTGVTPSVFRAEAAAESTNCPEK